MLCDRYRGRWTTQCVNDVLAIQVEQRTKRVCEPVGYADALTEEQAEVSLQCSALLWLQLMVADAYSPRALCT